MFTWTVFLASQVKAASRVPTVPGVYLSGSAIHAIPNDEASRNDQKPVIVTGFFQHCNQFERTLFLCNSHRGPPRPFIPCQIAS